MGLSQVTKFNHNDVYVNHLNVRESKLHKENNIQKEHNLRSKANLANYKTIEPDHSWIISDNPNSELNFDIEGSGLCIGDVNGDGLNDILYKSNDYDKARKPRDERTPDLNDVVDKVIIYWGGNFSEKYDQIIYLDDCNKDWRVVAYPLGDINNDGYDDIAIGGQQHNLEYFLGSSTGLISTGVYEYDLTINGRGNSYGFADFDNDGYGDYLKFSSSHASSAGNDIQVYWGSSNVNNIIGEVVRTEAKAFMKLNIDDVDGDGKQEIITLSGIWSPYQTQSKIHIYTFNTSHNLILEQEIILPDSIIIEDDRIYNIHYYNLSLCDIDGDGFKEIYFYNYRLNNNERKNYILTKDESFITYYNNELKIFVDGEAIPIGDLDNDNSVDFWYKNSENDNVYIALGPSSIEDGLQFDFLINDQSDILIEPEYQLMTGYGDIDGDGVDDAILTYDNNHDFGRQYIIGDSGTSFSKYDVLFSKAHFYDRINTTANVDDINSDGIEDFAFLYQDKNMVEIYFGGNTLPNSPGLTFLPSNGGKNPISVVGGDFNGDKINDIAINYFDGKSCIEIYFGSTNMDTEIDHLISADNIFPELELFNIKIESLENVGDINNDGMDDLAFAMLAAYTLEDSSGDREYLNTVYVLLGNTTLSDNPDIYLNYDPVELNSYEATGFRIKRLGDINADRIDDFAVSAIKRPFKGSSRVGVVYVHFGSEGNQLKNSSVVTPDLLLYPNINDAEYYRYFGLSIASGDYNGDDINDVAINAYEFRENSDWNSDGDAGIHIFLGNANMDDSVDIQLKVPGEVFGYNTTTNMPGSFGNLLFIPDLDEDSDEELLLTSGTGYWWGDYFTNAIIYPGNCNESEDSILVLNAANSLVGIGSNIWYSKKISAVGDFDNDNKLDLIIPQYYDNNDSYQSSRVYRYVLPKSQTSISNDENTVKSYSIQQNYPNPFNAVTKINYTVSQKCDVTFKVFNSLGQIVHKSIKENVKPGDQTISFNASSLPSGLYFYQINFGKIMKTKKMLLIK
jgi:hypothetical protein